MRSQQQPSDNIQNASDIVNNFVTDLGKLNIQKKKKPTLKTLTFKPNTENGGGSASSSGFRRGHNRTRSGPAELDAMRIKKGLDELSKLNGQIDIPDFCTRKAGFGDFENIGLLGKGTQGEVYKKWFQSGPGGPK